MEISWLITVLPPLFIITTARREKNQPPKSSSIVNGELAGPDEFKYIVSIGKPGYAPEGGGSILDERWIITARHVMIEIFNHENSEYFNFSSAPRNFVIYPKYDNDFMNSLVHPPYEIDKVFCHPISDDDLVFDTDSDLALVKLKDPIPIGKPPYYFEKIGFYHKDLNPKKQYIVTVAGWGQLDPNETTEEDRTDYRLRKADIPTKGFRSLLDHYRPDQQIALYRENVSFCNGDSGGPAVIIKNGKQHLVGVISYTLPPYCMGESILINAFHYKKWIQSVMRKEKDKYLCSNSVGGKEYNTRWV